MVTPRALHLAQSRLRIAQKAVADIAASGTFEEVADHWLVFLTAWKGVYTVLEQGSKVTPQARQWFGMKKAERRSTPLLQFLFHARNAAEHGLGETVLHHNFSQMFAVPEELQGKKIRMVTDPVSGRFTPEDLNGNRLSLVSEEMIFGSLAPVYDDRGKKWYGAPSQHRGTPINGASPIAVATAGLYEIRLIVDEAAALQTTSP